MWLCLSIETIITTKIQRIKELRRSSSPSSVTARSEQSISYGCRSIRNLQTWRNKKTTGRYRECKFISQQKIIWSVFLKLSKQRPVVRSIDIANDMNYSKPSISVAMKNLRLNGYINVDESGFITLTDSGMEIASNIYDRHLILRKWLEFLGISPETAEQDACKIEHTLSKETYAALRKHIIEEMGEE